LSSSSSLVANLKDIPERSIWKPAEQQQPSYVQTLNYVGSSNAAAAYSTNVNVKMEDDNDNSNTGHRKIDLVVQLTGILKTGSPVPFSILASSHDTTNATPLLLSCLNVCAVLVRGNWCLHSKFLPRFGRIRTFLLLLLVEDGVIDRRRVWERVYCSSASNNSSSSSINPDQLLALLQQIGKRGPDGWVLQVSDDAGFIENHPDTVALHADYWKRQRQRFQKELGLYNGGR